MLIIAKFEAKGQDNGLEDRMKQAMHSIAGNIMGKEMEPVTNTVLSNSDPAEPTFQEEAPEHVYWDVNRRMGVRRSNPPNYKTFQGPQRLQPSQPHP